MFSQSCYQYPGQWSWGYDKQIAHNFDTAGLEFTVNPWAWVPPDWYRKRDNPQMAKCIEHGKDGFAISAWNPLLIKINEDMYAQLKQNFGDSITSICPGIYGDYGEACYITGLRIRG